MQRRLTSFVLNRDKSAPALPFVLLALAYYILVAYKSSGFIQADEHYQIVEFANYKLGLLTANKLAWEFGANVRPGLQPLLCYAIFKVCGLLGITDHYNLAFVLRAVTACFSVFVITRLIKGYRGIISAPLLPYFVFFSYFLWFLPYINVRFSSETWSGLFLLLSLSKIQQYKDDLEPRRCAIVGLLLGVSVLFRYQSALFALGILLWLFFVRKSSIKSLALFALAVFLVLCVGVTIDYWLYGKVTMSVYHYFVVNIIEGKASTYGTSPVYRYVIDILTAPGPFGIIILTAFLVLCYRDPRNPLLWIAIPFLLIHSIVPHKEQRFIFPLANICPILCVLAFQDIKNKKRIAGYCAIAAYASFFFVFLANTAGLIAVATTGAGPNLVSVSEYIHRHYRIDTNIILNGDLRIYYDLPFAKNTYYGSDGLHTDRIFSVWQSDVLAHKKAGRKSILVISDGDITGPRALRRLKTLGLKRVYTNVPYLTAKIYDLYDRHLNLARIYIYEFAN